MAFLPNTRTRGIEPLLQLKPRGASVIVAPMYDADKVKGIIIPDSAKNPWTQQGFVVAAGPRSVFRYPDHVFYQPYLEGASDFFWVGDFEYLAVQDARIVGQVLPDGDRWRIVPRRNQVVIRPDFDSAYEVRAAGGLILLDPSVHGRMPAPRFGRVLWTGPDVGEVKLGDYVAIPPKGGIEIGFIDENLYVINQYDILAVMEKA